MTRDTSVGDTMAEELIATLCLDWRLVEFTDAWRDLNEHAQIIAARAWLRRALEAGEDA